MKYLSFFVVLAVVLGGLGLSGQALAVAIDDNITPQNCDRSNPACAQFLDTTSQGQVKWGGLIAGGLRSLTNFFVDGRSGFGTLRPSTGEQALRVDVEGAVGAQFYCDENGNNCVPGNNLGGGDGSTSVTINNGLGINVFRSSTTTNNFTISIDPTGTQRRIFNFCNTGFAISKVNEDGTVECVSVGSGTGNLPAGTFGQTLFYNNSNVLTASSNLFNTDTKVGIGTSALENFTLTVKQKNNQVEGAAKFLNTDGSAGGTIGRFGDGAAFFTNTAGAVGVSGVANNGQKNPANGSVPTGVFGHAPVLGAYASRFIGFLGTYTRGDQIALYATNEPGGVEIPANILNDGKSYAGYFNDTKKNANSYAAFFNGRVGFADGNQGAGKILSSDASGNATWKTSSELGLGGGTAGFTFSGPFNIFSRAQGIKTQMLGVHKICMLTVSQTEIQSGEWGNPYCKVGRNPGGDWYLQAFSDAGSGVGAHCEALCAD